MKIRAAKDFWSGAIFISVGLFFSIDAQRYGIGDMHRMGPGMFPTLIGVLMAGLGAVLVARSFSVDGLPVARMYARPIVVSLLAIFSFGALLVPFGLVPSIAALVVVCAFAGERIRIVETLALAAVLAVGSVVIFVWIVRLPIQLWPNW